MAKEERTRVVFTGDISFSKYFAEAWKDPAVLSDEVRSFLRAAGHTVGNVESPLAAGLSIQGHRSLNHVSDPGAAPVLRDWGVGCWSLANNHIMDCGPQGLESTMRLADENGCRTLGAAADLKSAARPLILDGPVKVGLLSIAKPWPFIRAGEGTPGALTWDRKEEIRAKVRALRETVRWVVFVVHGGDELANLVPPYIRAEYRKLLGLGADLIVGHHPHVVQNYETFGQKVVFYSLGNFVFDTDNQRDFAHTDAGVLLGVDFGPERLSFDHFPVRIRRDVPRVERGETPAVFRDIGGEDYRRLWPLEARYFYARDFRKRKKFNRKMKTLPGPLLLVREVYQCRHSRERAIQKSRMRSLLGEWKRSGMTDVVRYLQES